MGLYYCSLFFILSCGITYGKICSSMDIRNSIEDFKILEDCEVIEGFLYIVLINNVNETDLNQLSFPLLKEITCHLLFYHVKRLTSLRNLFPNLIVIRGQTLFGNYALIIYDMESLEEIGLNSLLFIQRGSVRIEMNPKLCFVNTIAWNYIAPFGKQNYFKRNKNPELCKSCSSSCLNCWGEGINDCQRIKYNQDCHPQCIGGCSGAGPENCVSCSRIYHENKCVSECPSNLLELLGRRCVTEDECRNKTSSEHQEYKNWKPYKNTCIDKCPPGYREVFSSDNSLMCLEKTICSSALINSLETAEKLNGCKVINGSLEIVNIQGGSNTIKEIQKHLDSIENITGYLKISRSIPLVSLDILPRLITIGGEDLEWYSYSVVIIENPQLSRLWPKGAGPKILRGRIFAQNNPKLCPSKLEEFAIQAKIEKPSDYEVSPVSNGNARTCYETLLDTNISTINPESVIIHWFSNSKVPPTLRFAIFYIELGPGDKLIKRDPELIEGCGSNEWQLIEINEKGTFSQNLINLKPYFWYAYYVTTYPFTNAGARSKIINFLTPPSQPSRPTNLEWMIVDQDIKLRWNNPLRPNGFIEHYLITPIFIQEDLDFLSLGNFCYTFSMVDSFNINKFSSHNNDMNFIANKYNNDCPENGMNMKCREQFDSLLDDILIKNYKGFSGEFLQEKETEDTIKVKDNEIFLQLTKPYGRYIIRVAACRRRMDNDLVNATLCSMASFVSIRTKSLPHYDHIPRLSILQKNKNLLRITWQEPEMINGAIVAFSLQVNIKRDESGHEINQPFDSLDWPHCIPRQQWKEQGEGLDLPSLPLGMYQIRIRAISLAGPGPFTEWVEWKQSHSLDTLEILIIVLLSFLLIVLFIILIYILLMKKKCGKSENDDTIQLINAIHNTARESVSFY